MKLRDVIDGVHARKESDPIGALIALASVWKYVPAGHQQLRIIRQQLYTAVICRITQQNKRACGEWLLRLSTKKERLNVFLFVVNTYKLDTTDLIAAARKINPVVANKIEELLKVKDGVNFCTKYKGILPSMDNGKRCGSYISGNCTRTVKCRYQLSAQGESK